VAGRDLVGAAEGLGLAKPYRLRKNERRKNLKPFKFFPKPGFFMRLLGDG
jgi:hypothetical protein